MDGNHIQVAHEQLEGKSTFVRLQATLKWLAFSFIARPSLPGCGGLGLCSERLCMLNKVLSVLPQSLPLILVTGGL